MFTANASQEEMMALTKGQILFQEGEAGGDLYFIQRGVVEIFREKDGRDVILTHMREGEIIGIMTCMTNEPRMASARAAGDIVVKRIRHDAIKKLVGNMPPWMKVVLKDFTIRLHHMNKNYTSATQEIRTLKANQISKFHIAGQLAASIGAVSQDRKKILDGDPVIMMDETLEHLSSALLYPKEELQEIFDIFVDAGMAKVKIDVPSQKTYLSLENAEKLVNFVTFLNQSQRGITRKLIQNPLTHRDHRILGALVKYAQKMDLNLSGNVRLPIKDLERNLEKLVGHKFEMPTIESAAKYGLVEIESEGVNAKVCLVPITLSRTLAHLSAHKKLLKLQEKLIPSNQEKSQPAA